MFNYVVFYSKWLVLWFCVQQMNIILGSLVSVISVWAEKSEREILINTEENVVDDATTKAEPEKVITSSLFVSRRAVATGVGQTTNPIPVPQTVPAHHKT